MSHNPAFPISAVNQHRPRAGQGGSGRTNPTISFGGREPGQATNDFYNEFGTFEGLQELVDLARSGSRGSGSRGSGTSQQKIIDLDPFKNKELEAMRELLRQQTQGQRTELTGDRARIGNAFKRFEALRNKKLEDSLQQNRGSASRRGFLDSGIFLKDTAELQNVSAGDISSEDVRSTALVNALSRQIGGEFDYLGRGNQDFGTGTVEALRSAQEASSTADIERSYLNARISQGGQG